MKNVRFFQKKTIIFNWSYKYGHISPNFNIPWILQQFFIRKNGIDDIEPKKIPLFNILSFLWGHICIMNLKNSTEKSGEKNTFFHENIIITTKIPYNTYQSYSFLKVQCLTNLLTLSQVCIFKIYQDMIFIFTLHWPIFRTLSYTVCY